MKVKFLQDYKGEVKSHKKGDVCILFWQLGEKLIKEKVVTDKLNRVDKQKLDKEVQNGK